MNPYEMVALGTAVLIAWGGVVVKMARAHIGRRVTVTCEEQIGNKVTEAIEPLRKQIENGLTHRQQRIEDKLDKLLLHLVDWDGNDRRS